MNLCPYCRQPITVVIPLYLSFEHDESPSKSLDNSVNDLTNNDQNEDQLAEWTPNQSTNDEILYLIPYLLYHHPNLIRIRIQTSRNMDRHLDRRYVRRYLSFRDRRPNRRHRQRQ